MQTMTYSVKEVPKADIDQVIDLWSLAFNLEDADPRTGTDGQKQRILQLIELGMDYVVGAYDGSSLAAVSAIIDFPMHVGNRWLTCGGIAGVATHPQHRRQNLVNKLLANCLQHLHQREVPISALWRFRLRILWTNGMGSHRLSLQDRDSHERITTSERKSKSL